MTISDCAPPEEKPIIALAPGVVSEAVSDKLPPTLMVVNPPAEPIVEGTAEAVLLTVKFPPDMAVIGPEEGLVTVLLIAIGPAEAVIEKGAAVLRFTGPLTVMLPK